MQAGSRQTGRDGWTETEIDYWAYRPK